MKKKQFETLILSTGGVAIMAVILIAINVIGTSAKVRLDLTEEHLFTLSDGTHAILEKLDTPVTVRYYVTQGENAMPVQLKTYSEDIADLLEEISAASDGQVRVERFDPEPDSDAEDSARLDGVEGRTLNLTTKVYLGLAVSSLDQKAAIPFLAPSREKLLEYDIMRAVSQVTTVKKPVIGIMSSLPVFGQPTNPMARFQQQQQPPQQPWVFVSELKRDFEVREFDPGTTTIDDDIGLIVLVHPKDLSAEVEYALDQFVLRGGKLIAFLDPLALTDDSGNAQNPMQRALSSGSTLTRLLPAWGLNFDMDKVVADLNFVSQVNRGGQVQSMASLLSVTPDGINTNDVVTSQIDNVLLPFSGSFSGTPNDGIEQTVLLKTTKQSQLVEKMMAQFSPEQVTRDFEPSEKEYTLAMRLRGKFKSAFPDGAPAAADADDSSADADSAAEKNPNHLTEASAESVVVLFGDSDLLYDQFSVQVQQIFPGQRILIPMNGNLNLVQSLVEQLAGDSNLIAVRSRASLNRPFTLVRTMQTEAESQYRSKIQQVEKELETTQQRLNSMQVEKKDGQRFILSPEQQTELENFREKEAELRKELKTVRRNLRKDIDSLENNLKWMNIAGMPLLVAFGGIVLALVKRKKTSAK